MFYTKGYTMNIETLTLKTPLQTLSGETITELHFKFDGLKPRDYREMVRLEARLKGVSVLSDSISTKKTSPEFRMAAAWIAAVKGTENVCLDDIDNINMLDLLELEEIGVVFFANLE